ncbi:12599_t:CDS:2 [Ambispora gerdemannii]|uniref:12599_t:CDS:1 n=1 Tax=Ambispora gerdemannii TaxID=144530 RepID=A0A9N8VDC8_9GLOM|nr:12599_t:CDS:2 [Ambispora gerdemannii]
MDLAWHRIEECPSTASTANLTQCIVLVSVTKDSNLDWLLGKYVSAEKLQRVKLLFEIERMNSLSKIKDKEVAIAIEIEKKNSLIKDKEIEIAICDNEFSSILPPQGYLNLSYLRLKGAVHLRGVFEQWELLNLEGIQGDRGTKWTRYLDNRKNVLEIFQNVWSNPRYNAYAVGDYVEWRRSALTSVQNEAVEYMCKELNIKYQIVEPADEGIKTSTTNTDKTKTDEPTPTNTGIIS